MNSSSDLQNSTGVLSFSSSTVAPSSGREDVQRRSFRVLDQYRTANTSSWVGQSDLCLPWDSTVLDRLEAPLTHYHD